MENFKRCLKCESVYGRPGFPKDVSKKDGLSIYCRKCHEGINKKRRSENPETNKEYAKKSRSKNYAKNRDYALRTRYGITLEEFDKMFDRQNHKCKICGASETEAKNFAVDHCHKTGKVRGILCFKCNRGLGIFGDSMELMMKAYQYLGDKNV